MTDDMLARVDAWIASQPGYVSRQDAVRRCIDIALGAEATSQPLPQTSAIKWGFRGTLRVHSRAVKDTMSKAAGRKARLAGKV